MEIAGDNVRYIGPKEWIVAAVMEEARRDGISAIWLHQLVAAYIRVRFSSCF